MRSFFVNIPLSPLKVCHTPSEQMRHQTNTRTQRNKHNTTPNTRTEVPPLRGLNKCTVTNNPGLAPWVMKKYRPVGAHCPTAPIPQQSPQYHKQYNHNHTNTKKRPNTTIHLHIQTHLTNTTPQTPNTTKSPVRAALLHSPG